MASKASEAFQALIESLASGMKAREFDRHRSQFSKQVGGNIEVVDFQRNPSSDPGEYAFFVNLGVVSRLVAWFETGQSRLSLPLKEYHWRARLGELLPHKTMWGWKIEERDDAPLMAQSLLDLLDRYGFPALETHASDQALLECWNHHFGTYYERDIR